MIVRSQRRVDGAVCRAAVGLMALMLAACASLPPGALDRKIEGRTVEGRMSVHYKDLAKAKEDSATGRFVWTASADEIELSLLDPLGQTYALIRSDAKHSSITFRDGRRVDGATPEALTQQTLGWTMPLHGLRYWLEGIPDPTTPVASNDEGLLRQDNWTVRFQRNEMLPLRIDLTYPGPPVSIDLRLVVDQRSGK
jgi:outer membrane lipoprotein LolB